MYQRPAELKMHWAACVYIGNVSDAIESLLFIVFYYEGTHIVNDTRKSAREDNKTETWSETNMTHRRESKYV